MFPALRPLISRRGQGKGSRVITNLKRNIYLEGLGRLKLTIEGKETVFAELGKNILGREATYAKVLRQELGVSELKAGQGN